MEDVMSKIILWQLPLDLITLLSAVHTDVVRVRRGEDTLEVNLVSMFRLLPGKRWTLRLKPACACVCVCVGGVVVDEIVVISQN